MTPARLGIIIALLATTLLGATGALVYRFTQRTSQPVQEVTSVSPTQTPPPSTPPSSSDAMVPSNWKTYVNSSHGISFRYPNTWSLSSETQAFSWGDLVSVFIKGPTQKNGTEFYDGGDLVIAKPVGIITSMDEWLKAKGFFDPADQQTPVINQTKLGGQAATEIYRCGLGCSTYVFTERDSTLFGISYFSGGEKRGFYNEQIKQILSTFEFSVSDQEKLLIDSWLEQNNLNQYGDPKDTMYAGGTPLFDERTGERVDRYDYILKKYPERPWND